MYKYIFDLEEAFRNVSSRYTSNRVHHSLRVDENTQGIERPFMSELYHQWRVIMEKNPSRYSKLILHSNIGKVVNGNNVEFPDLVLHGGQIGENRRLNEVVVEIKMNNYSSIDVSKLFNALRGNLNYNKAVYILYNKTFEEIYELYRHHINDFNGNELLFRKFFFITKKDGLFSLNDLITYNNNYE